MISCVMNSSDVVRQLLSKRLSLQNIEKIFPVAFGYHSFVVEDQRGNEFTVKKRSKLHLYYSDCKGVKGTLITLDEDDNKKLFIL